MNRAVKAAIAGIPGTAWTPIRNPRPIWDELLLDLRRRGEIHGVYLEERPGHHRPADRPPGDLTARLPAARTSCSPPGLQRRIHQLPFAALRAEEHHRDYAQVEQVFADLADEPPAAPWGWDDLD